jgi:hypothetical protein
MDMHGTRREKSLLVDPAALEEGSGVNVLLNPAGCLKRFMRGFQG